MTSEDVLPYVQERAPDYEPAGPPQRLPGGNLNLVWRVPGAERSLIVKYAPPYIAADPDTPLDPSRLIIEARCLDALVSEGPMAEVPSSAVRAPRLLDVNEEIPVLLMEDVGDVPSIDDWLRSQSPSAVQEAAPALGRRLGAFIGRLHARTCRREELAEAFDNRPMQETRFAVQYQGVSGMLKRARISDAGALGERAETLGETLLEPGCCLTMGDLWPPSVLVAEDGPCPNRREEGSRKPSRIRLIDWELAHYGRPLQDVAHWQAHLWMQKHRAPSTAVADAVEDLWSSFVEGYRGALGERKEDLWTDREEHDAAVHFGVEILVRAVGPFQAGYVYAGLAPDHSAVQEAVTTAADAIRAPEDADILDG